MQKRIVNLGYEKVIGNAKRDQIEAYFVDCRSDVVQ
jgi:hypothetical protein